MGKLDKLQQRKAATQKQVRTSNEKKRKAENARKYKLGGMVVKAGLHTLADEVILGLLFAQKDALAENTVIKEQWRELGIKLSSKTGLVGLIVKFSDKPPEEVTKELKAKNLRWNRISKQWEGTFLTDKVADIRTIAGAKNVTVITL